MYYKTESLLKTMQTLKIQSHREKREFVKRCPSQVKENKQSSFVKNETVEITQRRKKEPTL